MNTADRGHTSPQHGGDGRFIRTVDTAERDAQAARLRSEGRTYEEIATTMKFTDRSAARKSVERCLAATVAEAADDLRTTELMGLDALKVAAWNILTRPHVLVQGGKIVRDGAFAPVPDPGPVLAAIGALLKISERRSKLLGLDAPVQVVPVGDAALDAAIADLEAQAAVAARNAAEVTARLAREDALAEIAARPAVRQLPRSP